MRVLFTGEGDRTTHVLKVIYKLNEGADLRFSGRNYGGDLLGVTVFLVCRDGDFKTRHRLIKADKCYFLNWIMSPEEFRGYDFDTTLKISVENVLALMRNVISKRKFKDFNVGQFLEDMEAFLHEKISDSGEQMKRILH